MESAGIFLHSILFHWSPQSPFTLVISLEHHKFMMDIPRHVPTLAFCRTKPAVWNAMQLHHQTAQLQCVLQSSCLSSPLKHGTNQYCDTLIALKAWRKCSYLLAEPSQSGEITAAKCKPSSAFIFSLQCFFFFPCSFFPLVFQYNSVNMKNKTAEEVYVEMLKPAETVTLKVQHRLDDFNVIKDVPGDGFYIRCVPVKQKLFSESFFV